MIPDLNDILGEREEVVQENECKICHELFLTHDASTICDRCLRESIIEDNEGVVES